jgi:ubiquinone/menaquinone biosynthesis C-methylase UbiE
MASPSGLVEAYRPFPDLEWRNALQTSVELPLLVRLLGLPRGGSLLEVGCGRGIGLAGLARLLRPDLLTGIDVDLLLLAKAESDLGRLGVAARLFRADVRALPFDDGSFDSVFDFGTSYHVSRPEAALREIARVLRPGGVFVHETLVAQALAHPERGSRRGLPWEAAPELVPDRRTLLWGTRRKADRGRVR